MVDIETTNLSPKGINISLKNVPFFYLVSGSNFNEKVYPDQKKCFTAKYVGSAEVAKPSGNKYSPFQFFFCEIPKLQIPVSAKSFVVN